MKWIGQHIWDYISRFRSDVYLENIDSGTIASGGNLGLDSNNKIVKSASPSGSIDLTSEVTGTLPVANGGTGATSLADNSILTGTGTSAITAEANFTYTGTALTIQAVTSTFSHGTASNLIVTNTGDNDSGGILLLRNERNSGSSANQDGDILGMIQFEGHNDAGTPVDKTYALIKATAPDVSSGAEEGQLSLQVASHDGEMQPGVKLFSGDAEDEVEVIIGNGANSVVDTDGIFRGGNIGVIQNSKIPISPTQFITDSYRYAPQYNITFGGISPGTAGINYYAEVVIPAGYTATSCTMYAVDADNDATLRCYSSSIDSNSTSALAAAVTFSSGVATHDFGANDVDGNGAKTIVIVLNPGDTTDVFNGGYISIQKTT